MVLQNTPIIYTHPVVKLHGGCWDVRNIFFKMLKLIGKRMDHKFEHSVRLFLPTLFIYEYSRIFVEVMARGRVHAVAQWLRHCATNRKVTGSIPDSVIVNFH
jgi:hypothetical protein